MSYILAYRILELVKYILIGKAILRVVLVKYRYI